ncbi:MAG: ABC transporter ATP-binding protein [Spirochaetales bacterium]|nr:ABC transporter ATP-binding protein [Spirochaetales bacterium]
MIECENLVKIYKTGDIEVVALQGLDLLVEKGEFMAVIGNSGSGKSTLLNMLGGLDKPSAGKLTIDNKELLKFTENELNIYRRDTVGFVWQNSSRNLIPYLPALDNIILPMVSAQGKEKIIWALELLRMIGLYNRRRHKLIQLSGGEQQRVAIAIALANKPKILLADEPTGCVDTKTTDMILDIFREFNQTMGITIVIVTHDMSISRKVDRIVAIRNGKVSSEFIHKRFYSKQLAGMKGSGLSDDLDSHIEMVVLDRTGRLQLPKEIMDDFKERGINKLLVSREGEKVVLSVPEKSGEV